MSATKPPVTAVPNTIPPITIPPINIPPAEVPQVPTNSGPTNDPNSTVDTNPIEVKAPVTAVPDTIPPITIPPINIPPADVPQLPTNTGPTKTALDKFFDYLRLAGLASGTLGSLFGGGSGGGNAGKYFGTGTGNPIFSAKLPEASLPGGVSSMSARPVPEQNWYEYGYHPGQSFFNTSAPGYTPKPGKTPGMARGGDFAVRGPGTGRSDSIPARLSDGEYVMDAETVALLGDGSTKAGAQKLDQFRVNLRKQKGRNLARGEFSVKAKRPEAYLAGGRT